jgi:hypothetical protein
LSVGSNPRGLTGILKNSRKLRAGASGSEIVAASPATAPTRTSGPTTAGTASVSATTNDFAEHALRELDGMDGLLVPCG